MVNYSVIGNVPRNIYQNNEYYKPSFQCHYTQNIQTKNQKQGLSAGAKITIGVGIVTALTIGTDFLICKGKHVKNLLGKLKKNKTKSEIETKVENAAKTEVKPNINPASLTNKIQGTNITKIKTDEEYIELLKKLENDNSWKKEWNIKGANPYETGLMPYAHTSDIHSYINGYLRGEKLSPSSGFTEENIQDYIKLTDYALDKLDKVHGSYRGVVYRYGRFNSTPKAYTSTANTPFGAVCHADKFRPYKQPYNIILTKHGSKIEKLQEKLGNVDLAQREQEILLRLGHNYQEIETLTPELEELKQQLFVIMKTEHGYLHEDLVNLHFWQEI